MIGWSSSMFMRQPVACRTGCNRSFAVRSSLFGFLEIKRLVAVQLPPNLAKDWTRLDFQTLISMMIRCPSSTSTVTLFMLVKISVRISSTVSRTLFFASYLRAVSNHNQSNIFDSYWATWKYHRHWHIPTCGCGTEPSHQASLETTSNAISCGLAPATDQEWTHARAS
jgi:hypothetical protein